MSSIKYIKKYFLIVVAFLAGLAVGLSFAFQVGTSVLRSENENLEKDLVRVSDELARALRGEEVVPRKVARHRSHATSWVGGGRSARAAVSSGCRHDAGAPSLVRRAARLRIPTHQCETALAITLHDRRHRQADHDSRGHQAEALPERPVERHPVPVEVRDVR